MPSSRAGVPSPRTSRPKAPANPPDKSLGRSGTAAAPTSPLLAFLVAAHSVRASIEASHGILSAAGIDDDLAEIRAATAD